MNNRRFGLGLAFGIHTGLIIALAAILLIAGLILLPLTSQQSVHLSTLAESTGADSAQPDGVRPETIIWAVDLSTYQTLGTDWLPSSQPVPVDFIYQPWEATLQMLERVWTESDQCHVLAGFVSGPEADVVFRGPPCLQPEETLDALRKHGPTGWYEPSANLLIALTYARTIPNSDIYIVARGPVLPWDERLTDLLANVAIEDHVAVHVVPMGNEPARRFPALVGLQDLAGRTGGKVYYYDLPADVHDYSALPSSVAGQILADLSQ